MSLDFLNPPEGEEPVVAPEAEAPPTPEPTPEPIAPEPEPTDDRPRDANGRFISPQADEPTPANQPPPGYVPVSAVQAERAKAQAYADQLARYQQAQTESGIPDPYTDPEGYAAYHQEQVAQAAMTVRLDISEDMARSKHGDEVVNSVLEWAQGRFAQSPAYRQEVLSQRNPYEYAVQAYQREQALASVDPSELDAFRQWKAAQGQQPPNPLSAPAPVAAAPQSPVAPPPPSLNSAPSAGVASHIPQGPGQAFDGIFARK